METIIKICGWALLGWISGMLVTFAAAALCGAAELGYKIFADKLREYERKNRG